jgi:MFS family permease
MQSRFRGLWQHPDFLRLWLGQSVSTFGSLIGRVALPMLIVLVLDATPMQVSLLRTLEVAPGLLAGLFAGVWVDRLRRLPIMIAMDIGRALAVGSIPVAYLLGGLGMGQIYVVGAVVSILTVCFDVAYHAYLPSIVTADQLVEANSRMAATDSVAEIAGFGLAGVLVQLLTAPFTILFDAVSFLVSVASLLLIRQKEDLPPPAEHHRSTWGEIREGMGALFGHPILRALVGASGIDNLFGNIIGTVIMLFVLRELNVAPALAGVLFGLGGVSSLIGATLATPAVRRFGLGRTIIGASLMAQLSTFFLALAGGPLWLVIAMLSLQQLLGDGAATVGIINSTSLRQAVTPNRVLGRVNATLQVSNWTFMLLGTLLGGILGELIGLRGALLVAAGGKLLSVLWLWLSPVRTLRDHTVPSAGSAGAEA